MIDEGGVFESGLTFGNPLTIISGQKDQDVDQEDGKRKRSAP